MSTQMTRRKKKELPQISILNERESVQLSKHQPDRYDRDISVLDRCGALMTKSVEAHFTDVAASVSPHDLLGAFDANLSFMFIDD
jgi:hypothetical protein